MVFIDTCSVKRSVRTRSPWRRVAQVVVSGVLGICLRRLWGRLGAPNARLDDDRNQRGFLSAIERIDKNLGELERRSVWAEQLRSTSDRHLRRINILAGLVVFAMSAVGAFLLFLPSMAGPPLGRDPGRVGIALIGQTDPQNIQADLFIDASVEDSMSFTLAVSDFGTDHSVDPLKVVIYACGRVRENLVLQEVNGGKILELKPIDGSPVVSDSLLGDRSECTYTVSTMASWQILISAVSTTPVATRSGDGIMYTLPGLTTLLLDEAVGRETAMPLPRDSRLNVALQNVRGDFSVTASVPQIPESGRLAWTTLLDPGPDIPNQYRISGTLATERNRLQAGIFAAGALVGVAGAALLFSAESALGSWYLRRAKSAGL